jgi:hypothetical protein
MKRSLWLLAAAVLLLALVLAGRRLAEKSRSPDGFAFDTTQVSRVTGLRVIYQGDTALVERRTEGWMTADGFPADTLRVERALRGVLGVRTVEKVSESESPERLAEYGIDSAEAKIVEWTLASGEKQRVLLGKTSGADLSSTYWKREDEKAVYRTPGSFTFDLASLQEEWNDTALYPAFAEEDVRSLTVDWTDSTRQPASGHYKIARVDDSTFALTEPTVMPLPAGLANKLFRAVAEMRVDHFARGDDSAAFYARLEKPSLVVRTELRDGVVRTFKGGGARAGYFYIEYPYNRKPVLVYRRRLDVFKLGPRDFSQPAFALPE